MCLKTSVPAAVLAVLALSVPVFGFGLAGLRGSADFQNNIGNYSSFWAWEGGPIQTGANNCYMDSAYLSTPGLTYTSQQTGGNWTTIVDWTRMADDPRPDYRLGWTRFRFDWRAEAGASHDLGPWPDVGANGMTAEFRLRTLPATTSTSPNPVGNNFWDQPGVNLGTNGTCWALHDTYVSMDGPVTDGSPTPSVSMDPFLWHTFRIAVLGDDLSGHRRANIYLDGALVLRSVMGSPNGPDHNGKQLLFHIYNDAVGETVGVEYDYARIDASGAYAPVSTTAIPGDANFDGKVDSADLAVWQQNYDPLGNNQNTFAMGDWDGNGLIDSADLALWQQNYDPIGTLNVTAAHTPEPATLFVMMAAGLPLLLRRKRPVR